MHKLAIPATLGGGVSEIAVETIFLDGRRRRARAFVGSERAAQCIWAAVPEETTMDKSLLRRKTHKLEYAPRGVS